MLIFPVMIATTVYGNTCRSEPKCSCDFASENDISTTTTEMLAGAVGAMSPLLAAGAGLGIYKCIQSCMSSSKQGFERAPSDLTDDSYQDTKQKKFSRGRRNSTTPLRTETSDLNLSRRGSNATTLSVTDYDDWEDDSERGMSPISFSEVSARITPAAKNDNINAWLG
ncbi:uncharacterized protein LOC132562954 [Ylistrum balloti]|uniref:uncharacterized protein LOC132562954 n=1 Tax=Ylistrum balloti TaxID=509963 RepID=UPI002905CCE2|nr:uncharacterized protein LOC132562954 [Ylistrum balloti]